MIRSRSKLLPLLISAMFVSSPVAFAAQLGKIAIVSKPDQNFAAQITVERVLPGERESMKVGLASPEAFAAARLAVDPSLSKLKFSIRDGAGPGTVIVDVSATAPIPAGFLDALVELSWAGGKVTREYTLAVPVRSNAPAVVPALPELPPIKPTGTANPPATSTANAPASAPAGGTAAKPAVPPTAAPAPAPTAPPTLAPTLAPTSAPTLAPKPAPKEIPKEAPQAEKPSKRSPDAVDKTLRVKRGDTLSQIALEQVGDGASLNQAMAAIYEANPDAFIKGSIHLLKPGAELRIPNRTSMRARSKNEALVILAQGDDRNDFSRVVKQMGLSMVVKQEELPAGKASGRIEQAPPQESSNAPTQDRLKIAPGVANSSQAKADRAAEELIAKEKALAEANERIALLEKNVTDLQKLLEMQSKSASGSSAEPAASTPAAAGQVDQNAATAAQGAPANGVDPAQEPAPTEAPTEAPIPVPVAPPVEPPKPEATPEPVAEEPTSLLSNPWVLGGGVGLSLAILGGLLWQLKRRKQAAAVAGSGDSEQQDSDSFNEALAWATAATLAPEEAPEKPNGPMARVVDEALDLDEILSSPEPTEPTRAVAPAEPPPRATEPALAAEDRPEIDLDFNAQDSGSKADVNPIFDDLEDLEKGAQAAQKEMESLRAQPPAMSSVDEDALKAMDDVLDLDEPASGTSAEPSQPEPMKDLSDAFDQAAADLDLDLPGADLDPATRQEVETKLDLAGAYVEIGDSDGASELLKEIIEKGDAAQVKKAKDLLAGLK